MNKLKLRFNNRNNERVKVELNNIMIPIRYHFYTKKEHEIPLMTFLKLVNSKKSVYHKKWSKTLKKIDGVYKEQWESEPTLQVISQVYNSDSIVKPYFDCEKEILNGEYNKEIEEEYFNTIKEELMKEFNYTELVYASNHREITNKGEKYYKYSFHVLLSGIETTPYELRKYVRHINNQYPYNLFDIKVYNKHGLFRFSNQRKADGDKRPYLSHSLYKYIITLIDDNSKKYTNEYIDKTKIETVGDLIRNNKPVKKTNKKVVKDKGTPKFEKGYHTESQLIELEKLLLNLPPQYFMDYDKWRNVCFALKHFSASEEVYNLFVKFSNQHPTPGGCINMWNSTKNNKGDKNITMSSLIYIDRLNYELDQERKNKIQKLTKELNKLKKSKVKEFKNKLIKIIKQKQLKYEISLMSNVREIKEVIHGRIQKINGDYNPIDGVHELGFKVKEIESEYVTEKDTYEPIIKAYTNRINLIKSPTGTGKTDYIQKYIIPKFNNNNIITITPRRSIARKHAFDFGLTYYENGRRMIYERNIALQLDSLNRLAEQKGKYILILDELNTTTRHFLNNMDKMRKNRVPFVDRLIELMDNSYMCIGLDADFSTYVLKYLNTHLTKKILLTINKYQQKFDCPVNHYETLKQMVERIRVIKQENGHFGLLSDSKTKLKQFIETLKQEGIINDTFEVLDPKTGNYKGLMKNMDIEKIKSEEDKSKEDLLKKFNKKQNLQIRKKRFEWLFEQGCRKASKGPKKDRLKILPGMHRLNKDIEKGEKIEDAVLLYTVDVGDKADFTHINQIWENHDFAGSPTIGPGLSYDNKNTHHVCGLYFADNDMSSCQHLQQLARVRHPISINLWIDEKDNKDFFESREQIEEFYESYEEKENIFKNKRVQKCIQLGAIKRKYIKYIEPLLTFYYDELWHKQQYSNLQYWIPELLKQKGFYNYNYYPSVGQEKIKLERLEDDTEEIIKKYKLKDLPSDRMKQIKENIRNFRAFNIDDPEQMKYLIDVNKSEELYLYNKQRKGEYKELFKNNTDPLSHNSNDG
jgi:hypothetical protein